MSSVPKDNKNLQVYAGIALRIGLLSEQYEKMSAGLPDNQKYDVTLHLCLLQTLLTNVVEQLANKFGLGEWNISYLDRPIRDRTASEKIGLNTDMITSHYDKGIKILDVLHYIRNSLSHPTKTLPGSKPNPSTGYTVHESDEGIIESIEFVVGRHNHDNDFRRFDTVIKATEYINNNRLRDVTVACSDIPPCYYLVKNGSVFAPVFRIRIPVKQLKVLVRELSLLLAQPLKEDWPNNIFDSNIISEVIQHQFKNIKNLMSA